MAMTTPKKKTWCRHIRWDFVHWRAIDGAIYGWMIALKYVQHFLAKNNPKHVPVPDSWKLCPICGKERPKG